VAGPRSLSFARKACFALLTLALLLGFAELGLRWSGLPGSPDRTSTWFAEHILNPPLVHNKRVFHPRMHFLRPGQTSQFHPFAAEPAKGSLRVAVLGGSAAHGYGVLEPAAFPHRVELLLQGLLENREVQVINFGTVAWSSQQLLWAARQLWELGPWDLLIVYSGHNELLELSSWKTYLSPAAHHRLTASLSWAQRLQSVRLVALLRLLVRRFVRDSSDLSDQSTHQNLNLLAGLDPVAVAPAHSLGDMIALPVPQRARMGAREWRYAADTFEHNIGAIVVQAQQNETPVLLVSPPANDLQDPIGFSPAGHKGAQLDEGLLSLRQLMERSDLEAMEEQARALVEEYRDPRAMHLLAQALGHQGGHEEALHWYEQARAWTEYPSRIVPLVRERILSMSTYPGVMAVLDAETGFRELSEHGVIGYEHIYDHCHPSVEGHRILSRLIIESLFAAGFEPLKALDRDSLEQILTEDSEELFASGNDEPRLWRWDGRRHSEGRVRYLSEIPGGFDAVRAELELSCQSADASAMDWLWLGNARFYDYALEESLAAYKKSLSLDPGLCLAWANSAYLLRTAGAREEALASAEQAGKCAPQNAEFEEHRALLEMLLTR
jgi:tetratricopeptide (TPR) repeat protein